MLRLQGFRLRCFPKLGLPFFGGGLYSEDYSIWGSILEPSYLRKVPDVEAAHIRDIWGTDSDLEFVCA